MKKIKSQARDEIFRQKPLTLTLLLDVQEHLVALKRLIQTRNAHRKTVDRYISITGS